ncbi:MAG TPA: glycoside hydrolase [Blastocatellia bacterium]|nr:glycoside hydrolase [Blastocatellia bacterium]
MISGRPRIHLLLLSFIIAFSSVSFTIATAQQYSTSLYQNLRWRCIGPFRAGRTVGAVGIPNQPNVFFIGVNNGGVWKTTDAGRTWQPIFDDQPTGSIGDLAVAPSNPDIIYVGSGEGLPLRPDLSVGDGVYKSTDGGRTWRHMGLRDGQQIGSVIVDPKDPNRVFVAVCGHPFGPNQERGVFRSLDGGETWQKVLYRDENTGAIQVEFDPSNPQIVYADLYEVRHGPWENGQWQGPGSGLYKSTDGGTTWRQLTRGLPTFEQGLGRIGFGIARSNPQIIYATVDANPQVGGIYRSDDAGESWRRVSNDQRTWGRGSDFAEIRPHPKNPEIVFVANTASYKSTDGGKTWTGFKGAPGGDDYHRIWINPEQPDIMLFASDQGATITVNGGETWSSWYNQPTAQMYHVITDNRWPYWVYSGQQESGSAAVASRGDYGAITWRDWRTVGVEEYGYVAPDPLNPDIIYGGKITRFDWKTGQTQNIAPEAIRSGKYRFLRTAPVIFSPVDKKTLYYAGNVLFRTMNGGNSWEVISPDLSREKYDIPDSIGVYRKPEMATMARRGVIYTIAPSNRDINTIWAGTDDGLIHITRDGGRNWKNITPPELKSWMKVSLMDASHFDNDTAYAAINTLRLDDLRPHIYRTHDGGRTWKHITNGIPDGTIVNVVREDPQRKGLLYAGTEQAVYVSFDDGEHWQSLRLNMPATSIRDLVVKDDDLVVGTHGRSFWILDNITPLRQISDQVAAADAYLFKPQLAYRVRRSLNTDTPIPPEEPMGQNPPDGALVDYYLKSDAGEVTLEILDKQNKLVRRYSSKDQPDVIDEKTQPYPSYWFRPPRVLSAKAGMQRWSWDLHYPPPTGFPRSYPMTAIYRDTPPQPVGPTVLPGDYTVKLTVDGKSFTQPLTIRMDPRVTTAPAGIAKMHEVAMRCYDSIARIRATQAEIRKLREQLKTAREQAERAGAKATANAIAEFDKKAAAIEGRSSGLDAFGGSSREPGLAGLSFNFLSLMNLVEGADVTPTTQAIAASDELQQKLTEQTARWNEIKNSEVKSLNQQLRQLGLPQVSF